MTVLDPQRNRQEDGSEPIDAKELAHAVMGPARLETGRTDTAILRQNVSFSAKTQLSLVRPSTSWVRATHSRKGHLTSS